MTLTTNAELESKRRNTTAFIERNPAKVRLLLSRDDLVWSGGSYERTNQRSLEAQELIFIPSNVQLPERRTIEGQSVTPEYILLGEYGTDIRRGDWFYIEGTKYEVVFVHPDKSYETRAEVMYRG